MRILYGGSLKQANARELLAMPDVDGGLLGGASLNVDEFMAVAITAHRLAQVVLMTRDEIKAMVARTALAQVPPGGIIGVGTGSTVNHFIDTLATLGEGSAGAVSRSHGIRVLGADEVDRLALYVDGADEIDPHGRMIKGGGAALTREKIVAELPQCFLCIANASKQVEVLGRCALLGTCQ